jgi:hypothetical protein
MIRFDQLNGVLFKTLSASQTSPAPILVSEPNTIAIFALSLIGFSARKKIYLNN